MSSSYFMRVCLVLISCEYDWLILCEYVLYAAMRVWVNVLCEYDKCIVMRVLKVYFSCEYHIICLHASIERLFMRVSYDCSMPCEFWMIFFPCEFLDSFLHASMVLAYLYDLCFVTCGYEYFMCITIGFTPRQERFKKSHLVWALLLLPNLNETLAKFFKTC